MKKIFALFIATLVLTAICGCGRSKNKGSDVGSGGIPVFDKQVSWGEESYGFLENYGLYQPVSDGWIALGGRDFNLVIVKLDEEGSKIWETSFETRVGDLYSSSVIEAPDGYIVNNPSVSSLTFKCDIDGNVVWAKNLGIHLAIADDSDGADGAGFVGVGGEKTPYVSTIFIAQYDFDGNLIREKPLGDDLKLFQYALGVNIHKILKVPNGYFLVGGWGTFGIDLPPPNAWDGLDLIPHPGDYHYFIASVGADGTFRWQKTMKMNVGDVAVLKDGIVALGQIYDAGYNSIPVIEKYDFELNSVWMRRYEKYDGVGDGFISVAAAGEDIFVSGSVFWGRTAFILGIKQANGKLFWEDELTGEYIDEDRNICRIDYSRIFITGEFLSLFEFDQNWGNSGTYAEYSRKTYLRQYSLYD